jgi:hypothetical protein
MPYKDKTNDAKRKRAARSMRHAPQSNFKQWLGERIAEVPASSDKRVWDVRLSDAMGSGDESDRTLRRYLDGDTTRPRVASAYRIGWGLRDLGVSWCSGPLSLLAGGYLLDFFKLLAVLSGGGVAGRRAALRFAFAAQRASGLFPRGRATRGFALQAQENRDEARAAVKLAAECQIEIEHAWELRRNVVAVRGGQPEFRLAADLVTQEEFSERVRVYAALTVIASIVAERGHRAELQIVRDIEWLSPIAQPPLEILE